jgi:hypothetical protein
MEADNVGVGTEGAEDRDFALNITVDTGATGRRS